METVEQLLAKEYEGKLFTCISVHAVFGKTFLCSKRWYAVISGKVYDVSDGKKKATGDTMLNVKSDCNRVGIYNSEKIYKATNKSYSYSEFKKLLKL